MAFPGRTVEPIGMDFGSMPQRQPQPQSAPPDLSQLMERIRQQKLQEYQDLSQRQSDPLDTMNGLRALSQGMTRNGNGIGGGGASPSFMGMGGAGFSGPESIGGYSLAGIEDPQERQRRMMERNIHSSGVADPQYLRGMFFGPDQVGITPRMGGGLSFLSGGK